MFTGYNNKFNIEKPDELLEVGQLTKKMTVIPIDNLDLTAGALRAKLRQLADKDKAVILKGFFKTGPGEYGAGDIFLGVIVPKARALAKEFRDLSLKDAFSLLRSRVHEERLTALFILILKFNAGDTVQREKIYRLYLKHAKFINNWDLVDLSAPNIVGTFLGDKSRKPLYALASSANLWERRIAILATFYFIKRADFKDCLAISRLLLADKEDLIHKAAGWMLREVGKKDLAIEDKFLKAHYRRMPRTMLRYAIEKFPEEKRRAYLKGDIISRAMKSGE
ncbi:MAG: DNA alkylation repair protein [Candidatus Omnitrophota bacterium]